MDFLMDHPQMEKLNVDYLLIILSIFQTQELYIFQVDQTLISNFQKFLRQQFSLTGEYAALVKNDHQREFVLSILPDDGVVVKNQTVKNFVNSLSTNSIDRVNELINFAETNLINPKFEINDFDEYFQVALKKLDPEIVEPGSYILNQVIAFIKRRAINGMLFYRELTNLQATYDDKEIIQDIGFLVNRKLSAGMVMDRLFLNRFNTNWKELSDWDTENMVKNVIQDKRIQERQVSIARILLRLDSGYDSIPEELLKKLYQAIKNVPGMSDTEIKKLFLGKKKKKQQLNIKSVSQPGSFSAGPSSPGSSSGSSPGSTRSSSGSSSDSIRNKKGRKGLVIIAVSVIVSLAVTTGIIVWWFKWK
jgi:hypothetical protein